MRVTKNQGTPITSNVRRNAVYASNYALSPKQKVFANQLARNARKAQPIMGATNTTNIAVKPEFTELLPLFVQKLILLDVYGSVAMRSRQQIIPYLKFVAENDKGATKAGDVFSTPFVNRQGKDPNFSGRKVVETIGATGAVSLKYIPVLPNSVSVVSAAGVVSVDDGNGNIGAATINYSTGAVSALTEGDVITYEYDNENVGPHIINGEGDGATSANDIGYAYGARMGKGYLAPDEINLIAEAHQLACYWSVYSAFALNTEYGADLSDTAKEAAFSEITAEINTEGFDRLLAASQFMPQYNWDATPIISGTTVMASDYLNMFKLRLNQAAAGIYQRTNLTRPNRLVVGTTAASYISMIYGFQAAPVEETVGPYKLGTLDQYEVYVAPNYDPNTWVMCCKSDDIRRNSALFGEYMPLMETAPIALANNSVQQGYATMYAMQVVNPDTVVSGKITGTY